MKKSKKSNGQDIGKIQNEREQQNPVEQCKFSFIKSINDFEIDKGVFFCYYRLKESKSIRGFSNTIWYRFRPPKYTKLKIYKGQDGKILGEGGSGSVYLVYDKGEILKKDKKNINIKNKNITFMALKKVDFNEDSEKELQNEISILSKCNNYINKY